MLRDTGACYISLSALGVVHFLQSWLHVGRALGGPLSPGTFDVGPNFVPLYSCRRACRIYESCHEPLDMCVEYTQRGKSMMVLSQCTQPPGGTKASLWPNLYGVFMDCYRWLDRECSTHQLWQLHLPRLEHLCLHVHRQAPERSNVVRFGSGMRRVCVCVCERGGGGGGGDGRIRPSMAVREQLGNTYLSHIAHREA